MPGATRKRRPRRSGRHDRRRPPPTAGNGGRVRSRGTGPSVIRLDATTVSTIALTGDPRRSPTIAPAFAASLLIHVMLGVALVGLASADRMARGDDRVPLAVRLVDPPAPPAPLPAPTAAEAIVSPRSEAAALPAASPDVAPKPSTATPAPSVTAVQPPAPAEVRPEPASPVPALGTVAIAEPAGGMAALSPDVVARSHGGYLIEVEKPVRVLRMPEVAYPQVALEAQREGTVVVWLAIDRDGAIEDVVVDSGLPAFVDAVMDALPSAKFLPAEERGELIPFYIALQFDFRIAGGATASPGAVAAEPAN